MSLSLPAPLQWDAETLAQNTSDWEIPAPRPLSREASALARWAEDQDDPVAALEADRLDLPAVRALGTQIAALLTHEAGLAVVCGLPPMAPATLKLLFLALGLELGAPIGAYGRIYDVCDRGESYREQAIPVSMTREATGMHTDSSNRSIWPAFVGLACLRPARLGGESRVCSGPRIFLEAQQRDPELTALLCEDFYRDIVTPGAAPDLTHRRNNRFPVFFPGHGAPTRIRYMRYWIERGHEKLGQALTPRQTAALDLLDSLLENPAHTMSFELRTGDLLFLNNRSLLHDRRAYTDDPDTPRHLLRLWLSPGHRHCPSPARPGR